MITEAKLKLVLKDMMKTKSLEEINVTALCKKCGVHRQTFYYHYTDIYDLIAAIYLNEDLSAADTASDAKGIVNVFLKYIVDNFSFLRSTYNSAARDLTDDFIFGKLNASLFALWTRDPIANLPKDRIRDVARRFSHFVSDEFGYCFKDIELTPEDFQFRMTNFLGNAIDSILPSLISLSSKEQFNASMPQKKTAKRNGKVQKKK